MKKWIATYILFVSCIIFSLSGAASCGQQFFSSTKEKKSTSQKTLTFESTVSVKTPKANEDRPDELCGSFMNVHAQGFSQVAPFLPEEYPVVFPGTIAPQSIAVPVAAVQNGYLLHLFPSHYFW